MGHQVNRSSRAVVVLLLGLALVGWQAPARAHGSAPEAVKDRVEVRAGTEVVVRPLANDSVAHKRVARVRIVKAPARLRADVRNGRKLSIRPRDTEVGRHRIVYSVTDKHGRRDRARVVVDVRPHLKSLVARTRRLDVATENRTGYDRSAYKHWTDADSDCFNTRAEVLLAETRAEATWNDNCTVQTGKWRSYYDGRTTTNPSDFDIDHLVPLAENWDSGGRDWTAAKRERFANDLGDDRSLVAVTASSNRSKSDRDPAEWMPARAKCRYVTEWVAVKVRWGLTVDRAEKDTLLAYAASCSHRIVEVDRAS